MKFFIKYILILTGICFFQLPLFSQIFSIKGRVIDKKTGKSIPYANVGLPTYSIGTSCNEEGDFIIKISSERLNDTLWVSSVGYTSYKALVSTIKNEPKLTIALNSTDISIDEFTFKLVDANHIIRKVLNNRPKNYATEPVMMQLFSREILKEKETNRYFLQAEGILEMYKSSVKKNEDQVRLVKGRKKNLPLYFIKDAKKYLIPEIVNGPNAGIILDVVKNPGLFILQNHQFSFSHEGYEMINDRPTYVINFTPYDSTQRNLLMSDTDFYRGKIYIDKENYALVRAVYSLSSKGLRTANNEYLNRKSKELKLKNRDYTVDYNEYNDKWYFKSGLVVNQYTHTATNLLSKIEIFTTKISIDNVNKIPERQEISIDEMLANKINHFDDSFWDEYNFIKSVESETNNEADSLSTDTLSTIETPVNDKKVDFNKISYIHNATPLSATEVAFFKGTFSQAINKATKQKKFIFLAVYAEHSEESKKLENDIAHNTEIAEMLNGFFINFKTDSESSRRKIIRQYGVKSFPHILFLTSDGDIIESWRGDIGIDSIALRISAFLTMTDYGKAFWNYQRFFNGGYRDFNLILSYAQMRKKLGVSNEPLLASLINELPKDTLDQILYKQFISNYAHDLQGATFDYVFKNRNQPLFETTLRRLIQTNVFEAATEKDENRLESILKANAQIETTPSVLEEKNEELRLLFYEKTKQINLYHECILKLLNHYYKPQVDINQQKINAEKIEKIAHYYAIENLKKDYIDALLFAILQLPNHDESAELLSAQSQLYYKKGNKNKAVELMKKSISISNNSNARLDIFSKMKNKTF